MTAGFDRARLGAWLAIAALTTLAWLQLYRIRVGMGTGSMAAMSMPIPGPGGLRDYASTFLMWFIMMVAMMLPSASPMLLIFEGLQARRAEQGRAAVRTAVFAGGYFAVWAGFSLLAALLQLGLQARLLITGDVATAGPRVGALFLALAGAYQLSSWKNLCLARCQSPLGFLASRWREGGLGAFAMGARHGFFCLGCCWAVMGLLFVGGVMNLAWVALLAVLVLAERVLPWGSWIPHLSGVLLLGWAIVLLRRA
jgi:predicted metal-binding membrane protein